jgi:hypothetical protein
MEATLLGRRFRSSLCQASVSNRSAGNCAKHKQKHEAIRIPYTYLIHYLLFHKSSERPLPLHVDLANPMPSPRWATAIGTGGSDARKESIDTVAGPIEALFQWRFERPHF